MSDQALRKDESPQLRLCSPAVDFIENRLPYYHEAFNCNTSMFRYDITQSQFVPRTPTLKVPNVQSPRQPRSEPAPTNNMEFWDDIFPSAMKRFQSNTAARENVDTEWNIRTLPTWSYVQAMLEKARQVYDHESRSQQVGKFRRKVRNALDTHKISAQQGMSLAPNVDMASPIVGAINLLLDAYCKAAEVREEVNSAFEDLPVSFTKMDFYLRSYPKDRNIIEASTNLVISIFKAIENSITFYTSSQAKRASLAVLKGADYQKKLLESLTEIRTRCRNLEDQASMSFTHQMLSDNERASRESSSIMLDNALTHHGLGALFHETQAQHATHISWLQGIFNQILSLMNDREKNWPPRSPFSSRPSTPQPLIMSTWTPRDLWSLLGIANFDEIDLQHVIDHAEKMIFEDRGRAQQLLRTHLFRKWITSPGSTKLLVHGDFRITHDISPFSTICAVLTQAFRQSGCFISLVFFCSRHLAWDDHHGGDIMIRSVIAQLLRQFPNQYIQHHTQISPQDIENGSIELLCNLFTYLIRQLPQRLPVVCIIDGISLYEAEEHFGNMEAVILCLLELVGDESLDRNNIFKLLLTSPQPTVEVRKAFDSDPDALVHMERLPPIEGGVGLGRLQEQLLSGI